MDVRGRGGDKLREVHMSYAHRKPLVLPYAFTPESVYPEKQPEKQNYCKDEFLLEFHIP
jgi:hypothetical protein